MWYTYWWEINDENSDLCGEEFFTELQTKDRAAHEAYIKELFPDETPRCLGRVSAAEAEMMGLDTY